MMQYVIASCAACGHFTGPMTPGDCARMMASAHVPLCPVALGREAESYVVEVVSSPREVGPNGRPATEPGSSFTYAPRADAEPDDPWREKVQTVEQLRAFASRVAGAPVRRGLHVRP